MMFKLEALHDQDTAAALARGESVGEDEDGGIDFSASDEDAWLDEEDDDDDDPFGFGDEEDADDVWEK